MTSCSLLVDEEIGLVTLLVVHLGWGVWEGKCFGFFLFFGGIIRGNELSARKMGVVRVRGYQGKMRCLVYDEAPLFLS